MTTRSRIFVVAMFVLSMQALAGFDDYPARSIAAVLSELAPKEDTEHLQNPGDVYIELGWGANAAKALLVCLGEIRDMSEERKTLLRIALTSLQVPDMINLFNTEILCAEGPTRFWLPIQESLLPHFTREVATQTPVYLFLRYIGSIRTKSKELEHVLVINAFLVP